MVQNHLFQVLANLAMEPPVRTDSESIRDEKVKVLKAIPPLDAKNVVRGQFRGYRKEKGVAPDSQVETFAALRLEVNSWRWQGVPFYIRAGKCLPVTCTEVVVRLRRPPTVFPACCPSPNYFRFRISPEVTIAFGLTVMDPEEKMIGQSVELLASRHPGAGEMDAYERLLGDAMEGDATLFAREDYVEEAWRIVDPVLKAGTPVYEYEPNTWGPSEVDQQVSPPGGWQNPVVTGLIGDASRGHGRTTPSTRKVTTMTNEQLDQLSINTIRTLSIDAVQQANSGHPGTPMALAPLVYTIWNRVHALRSRRTRSGPTAIGSCSPTGTPRCCSGPCSTSPGPRR